MKTDIRLGGRCCGRVCAALSLGLAVGTACAIDVPVNESVKGRENIEWSIGYSFHVTDAKRNLPRVLLVGDSICNGYKDRVIRHLDGRMNVSYWASSYCVTSPMHRQLLLAYLSQSRYDVIHFNNGLHSLSTDVTAWTNAFVRTVRTIRSVQPQAKLVWCCSTPLKDPARTAKARALNAAALEAIRTQPGMGEWYVNDLFSLLDPLDRHKYWSDVYHHRPAAIAQEAARVAACVVHAQGFPPQAGQLVSAPFLGTSDAPVWRGVKLRELGDFSCTLWGGSMAPSAARGFCTANDGRTAEVQFRHLRNGTVWCVKAVFTQKGDDVYGRAVYAKSVKNRSDVQFDFDTWLSPTPIPVASAHQATGYGACCVTCRIRK